MLGSGRTAIVTLMTQARGKASQDEGVETRARTLLTARRAVMAAQACHRDSRYVHANGIDIHYVETGEGEPLILLDNAMVSTSQIWESLPFAYAGFVGTLAKHFRVIAPDARGSGKSVHCGGPIPYTLLADDVAALMDGLHLVCCP